MEPIFDDEPIAPRKSLVPKLLALLVVALLLPSMLIMSNMNKNKKTVEKTNAAELAMADILPTPTLAPGMPCPIFPADNIFNRPIQDLPVDANSANYISTVGPTTHVATGFGRPYPAPTPFGMPYNIVPTNQPMLGASQYPLEWISESDPHPFPVPANPILQPPTDRHMLIIQSGTCKLYEFWHAYPPNQGATNEVTWDLLGNNYHTPARNPVPNGGVTSADAAGLPILPGLFRYEDVSNAIAHRDPVTGAYPPVGHAIRTTMHIDRVLKDSWIWPAYHTDGNGTPTSSYHPIPMGARLRLKANFPVTSFDPQIQVMLNTLKVYGLILADSYNGNDYSEFSIGGTPSDLWLDPGTFNEQIHTVHLSDFDVVDESGIMVASNSMQARMPNQPTGAPSPTTQQLTPTVAVVTPSTAPTLTPVPTRTPTPILSPTPTRTPSPTPTTIPAITQPLPPITAFPSITPIPASTDFVGTYFNDVRAASGNWSHLALSSQALSRYDHALNFNWRYGSPDPSVHSDHFSARWTRQINLSAGIHQFTTSHDDGMRIYLDGALVYNHWSNQSAVIRNFSLNIPTSGMHSLIVEYFETSGNASVLLNWQ